MYSANYDGDLAVTSPNWSPSLQLDAIWGAVEVHRAAPRGVHRAHTQEPEASMSPSGREREHQRRHRFSTVLADRKISHRAIARPCSRVLRTLRTHCNPCALSMAGARLRSLRLVQGGGGCGLGTSIAAAGITQPRPAIGCPLGQPAASPPHAPRESAYSACGSNGTVQVRSCLRRGASGPDRRSADLQGDVIAQKQPALTW